MPRTAKKGKDQDRYLELVRQFPLRPIRSEVELDEAIAQMDSLLDKDIRDSAEEDYLQVLSDLAERYEQEHHPIENATDAAILRHLIDARKTTQVRVARACEISESTVSEILAGKRKLNRDQIGRLARYFAITPDTFSFG